MPRGRQKSDTLIFNGDLKYQPPFVAEMLNPIANAWVDGTDTGSITDDQYRWNQVRDSGGMGFKFDQSKGYNALQMRTTGTIGRGRWLYGSNEGTKSQQSVLMLRKYAIPLLPNTSYTISCDAEILNVLSGTVRITVNVHNATGLRVVSQSGSGINGTSTKVSLTNTFNSGNGAFLVFFLEFSSFGTSDMYAWFSNIRVAPTAGLKRTRTEARTLEGGNRFKVNDYGTAYNIAATAKIVKTGVLNNFSTRSLLSFSMIIKAPLEQSNVAGNAKMIWSTDFNGASFLLCVIRNGSLQFSYFNNSPSVDVTVSTSFVPLANKQIKIGGTIDSDNKLRLYVNGSLVATSTVVSAFYDLTLPDISVGKPPVAGNTPIDGPVDSIRFWRDIALSPAEFAALHLNNIVSQKEKLIIEWLLNEGSGSVATDTSGNGNDGTITPGASGVYTTDVFCIERNKVV